MLRTQAGDLIGTGMAASARPTHTDDDDRFLPARQVWERYGVTSMTLWRWSKDERMDFPPPIYLNRFRYWRLSDLARWERARASRQAEAA